MCSYSSPVFVNRGAVADRILIAQAMSEPLHLITTDAKLKPYSELVVLV
jgi:PIN domain nuclease of toxin-antitoxin system